MFEWLLEARLCFFTCGRAGGRLVDGPWGSEHRSGNHEAVILTVSEVSRRPGTALDLPLHVS